MNLVTKLLVCTFCLVLAGCSSQETGVIDTDAEQLQQLQENQARHMEEMEALERQERGQ